MKKIVDQLTVLLVSFFMLVPSFAQTAQDVKDMGFWEQMSGGTSTLNTYKKLCGNNGEFLETFNMENYTKMCEVLLEHELCKDIPEDEKVDCDNPEQNETNYLTPWMLWNCVHL